MVKTKNKRKRDERMVKSQDFSSREFLALHSSRNRVQRIRIAAPPPTAQSDVEERTDQHQQENYNDYTDLDTETIPPSAIVEENPGGVKVYQKAKRYVNSVGFISLTRLSTNMIGRRITLSSLGATNIANSTLTRVWR
jgi:hypothetical protein